MAGQMVQYRHFNLDSVLDREARGWTERTLRVAPERLPLDRRDLVTGREVLDPLVEVLDREREAEQSMVEWLEEGW